MPLLKVKPTSPGRRALVKVVTPELHKGDPHWALTRSQIRGSGRNTHGRITTLALLLYADGERRYVIAAKGVQAGAQLMSGANAPIKAGNALPLRNIPVGTIVHCVEMLPGKGAQLARSAGAGVQVLAREGSYAQLRLRSGEIRKVHIDCRAAIGEAGNAEHNLESIGKAGRVRWRGVRPTVRGVAMNPIDHPHGGGEGRTAAAQPPVSPWGVQSKGYKTRKNKRTQV